MDTIKVITPILVCVKAYQNDHGFFPDGRYFILLDSGKHKIDLGDRIFKTAFDILFKIYYVFNLKFEKSSKRMFNYLECFVYKISNVNPLISVNQIYKKLQSPQTASD